MDDAGVLAVLPKQKKTLMTATTTQCHFMSLSGYSLRNDFALLLY
jgi:hypothetical protein